MTKVMSSTQFEMLSSSRKIKSQAEIPKKERGGWVFHKIQYFKVNNLNYNIFDKNDNLHITVLIYEIPCKNIIGPPRVIRCPHVTYTKTIDDKNQSIYHYGILRAEQLPRACLELEKPLYPTFWKGNKMQKIPSEQIKNEMRNVLEIWLK